MFTDKSFQSRIKEANKVFSVAVEKLKSVQTDILARTSSNQSQIQKLTEENSELDSMKAKTEKQIEEISRFIA